MHMYLFKRYLLIISVTGICTPFFAAQVTRRTTPTTATPTTNQQPTVSTRTPTQSTSTTPTTTRTTTVAPDTTSTVNTRTPAAETTPQQSPTNETKAETTTTLPSTQPTIPATTTPIQPTTPSRTTTPVTQPSAQPAPPLPIFPDITEFGITFNDADTKTETPITPPTDEQKATGLIMDLPYIGQVLLIPYTDPQTKTDGFIASLAEQKFVGENFLLNEATITFLNNNFGAKGTVTLFGKKANFKLKNAELSADNKTIKKMALDVSFNERPTFEIIPGKSITLQDTTLMLEQNKPIIILALTNLFGSPMYIGFVITKQAVHAFSTMPDTPLVSIIPPVASTPLDKATLTNAKMIVKNIWTGTTAQTDSTTLPVTATVPTSLPAIVANPLELQRNATIHGIVDLSKSTLSDNPNELKDLIFDAVIAKNGIVAIMKTQPKKAFTIPYIGEMANAKIVVDTTKTPGVIRLFGDLTIDIPDTGTALEIDVDSAITTEGLIFAGTVANEFSYGDLSLKKFTVSYDTKRQAAALTGNIVLEGIPFKARILLLPNPLDKTKKTLQFTAQGGSLEIKPFAATNIEGLADLSLKNFSPGITFKMVKGKLTYSLTLDGDLIIFGRSIRSLANFVETEEGEKGFYINAPLTHDLKLGDIFPDLNNALFNGITFQQAQLVASDIDYTDPNTGTEIKKGLSFLATVPLTGSLDQVGKLIGNTGPFTMYGALIPKTPRLSQFGIVLSKGNVDATAKFALGQMMVAISGEPSLSVLAEVIFRPEPTTSAEKYIFRGSFAFKAAEALLQASMKGTWNNPFHLDGFTVSDPALLLGMAYGSPGIPTAIGGTCGLFVRDYLDLSIAFLLDAELQNIAFEGSATKLPTLAQICTIVIQLFKLNIPSVNFPALEFSNLHVKYAPKDTLIGDKLITQGLAASGAMDLLGKHAMIDLEAGWTGLKAYGAIDPINIGNNLLTVSGRGEKQQPEIDIEMSLLRQSFKVTGILTLADIYKTETYMEISKSGIEFNFEDKLGGDKFMWQGNSLLWSKVHGISGGSLSNPEFYIDIVFEQHLKQYILDQVSSAFDTAKNAVDNSLSSAQNEINKIDSTVADAKLGIQNAVNAVNIAQNNLNAINDAIAQVNNAFKGPQDAVASLQKQIDDLDSWYSNLPDV